MKKLICAFLSLMLFASAAAACDGPYLIKYGAANKWDFNLFVPDGSVYKVDATFDNTNITYTKNSGAVTAYPGSNITLTDPKYDLFLDPSITNTKRLHVQIIKDGTWFPKCVDFYTYGNALAEYQFDLNDPKITFANGGLTGISFAGDTLGKIGLAQAVTSNSITVAAIENFLTGTLAKNNVVWIAAATTGKYQAACICSNDQLTDKLTLCQNWASIPTGAVYYMILPSYHCSTN